MISRVAQQPGLYYSTYLGAYLVSNNKEITYGMAQECIGLGAPNACIVTGIN